MSSSQRSAPFAGQYPIGLVHVLQLLSLGRGHFTTGMQEEGGFGPTCRAERVACLTVKASVSRFRSAVGPPGRLPSGVRQLPGSRPNRQHAAGLVFQGPRPPFRPAVGLSPGNRAALAQLCSASLPFLAAVICTSGPPAGSAPVAPAGLASTPAGS